MKTLLLYPEKLGFTIVLTVFPTLLVYKKTYILGISQFSLPHMFKTAFSSIEALGAGASFSNVIVQQKAGLNPEVETVVTTVSEENPDYSDRKRYHHAQKASTSDVARDFD